jgi:hypothetical protein
MPHDHRDTIKSINEYRANQVEQEARRRDEARRRRLQHRAGFQQQDVLKSSYTDKIRDHDQTEAIEKEREAIAKRELVTKRFRYADIVKEMYVPPVDNTKKLEMDALRERVRPGQRPAKLVRSLNASVDVTE